MDADEVLDPAGADRIRELLDADGDGADAIEITLANYCDDMRAWRWRPSEADCPYARGFAGYLPADLLRLFRNGQGYEYREAVHESITASVLEADGQIRKAPILIHHYGYGRPGDARTREKAAMYLAIAREKAGQLPDNPKAWQDLAEQSLACGEVEEAQRASEKALELVPHDVAASTTLANILLNRGNLKEARVVLEGLEERSAPAPPHVLAALAAIAFRQGDMEGAARRVGEALERHPDSIMGLLTAARCRDLAGSPEEARALLLQAHELAPALDEAKSLLAAHDLRRRGQALFEEGRNEGALRALVDALKLDSEDPITHNDVGVVLAAMGQKEKAKESFERALRLAPAFEQARGNLHDLNSS